MTDGKLPVLTSEANAEACGRDGGGSRRAPGQHLRPSPRPHARTLAQKDPETVRELLVDAPTGACALQFEAGTGELLPLIEEHFDEVVAVDSSPLLVQWSRGTVKLCADGRLPFPDGIFEFVCGTLDRASRRRVRAYVAEAYRVLVPGGVLRMRVGRGCSTYGIRLALTTSPFEDFNAGAYSVERRWVTARKRETSPSEDSLSGNAHSVEGAVPPGPGAETLQP